MKQALLFFLVIFVITSCSSVKRNQIALNQGNYNEAISIAVEKLQKGKTRKANQEHIVLLEEAFRKLTISHKKQISFLEKESRMSNSQEIYRLYENLDRVQKHIAPLLPLHIREGNRKASFRFTDYSDAIISSKNAYADFLHNQSLELMENNDKLSYRQAHATLTELQILSPSYKNTDQLLRQAYSSGINFVLVELKNRTELVFPQELEEDLLNFNTYRLDDFWTEYHGTRNLDYTYDYAVNLDFREIQISPERILEQEIPLEAEVLDSYSFKKDRSGHFVRDSLGNKIRVEHYITVKGTLYKTVQTKSLSVQAKVDYLDLNTDQIINSYPLKTEFIFENVFADFKGDDRLLTKEDKEIIKNGFSRFPSNEELLVDASGDIKERLTPILKKYRFR